MNETGGKKFNPLDPLGIVQTAKDHVDALAVNAGLSPLPTLPGLQQRTEAERAATHSQMFPGTTLPPRGTGMSRILDPLGLFSRKGG